MNEPTITLAPAPPRSRKILIVEDNAPAAQLLSIGLRRLGHVVVGTATNGNDALAMADRYKPEVILMDINIPGMDGIKTAEKLSELGSFSIIFATGRCDDATLLRTRLFGSTNFLVKPFSAAQLKAVLERL